jgi:hypothetical protein
MGHQLSLAFIEDAGGDDRGYSYNGFRYLMWVLADVPDYYWG